MTAWRFLARAVEHTAIALSGVAVYRDGAQFRVERRLRRHGLAMKEWSELCDAFMEHRPYGSAFDLAERLRFGVVLANGETAFADAFPFYGGDPMAEPEGHSLSRRQQGGGGGGNTYASADHLWLWPLPPSGPIELVMQWPAFGIGETRSIIDGRMLPELAADARPYWPEPSADRASGR